ncbi:MAG: DUF4870 domain-containing protein [Fimbriimonadaceae bacterium]|nr:DUF4870 domain-containing protein [Fimbriimonadaceae bacterium]
MPSREDRFWAAVAHFGSVAVNVFSAYTIGWLVGLAVWLTHKNDKFAAFHGAQVFFFHLINAVLLWILIGLTTFLASTVIGLPLAVVTGLAALYIGLRGFIAPVLVGRKASMGEWTGLPFGDKIGKRVSGG